MKAALLHSESRSYVRRALPTISPSALKAASSYQQQRDREGVVVRKRAGGTPLF